MEGGHRDDERGQLRHKVDALLTPKKTAKTAAKKSVATQSKEAVASGNETIPFPSPAESGMPAPVTQEEPTGPACDPDDTTDESVESCTGLDILVGLCKQITSAKLKTAVEQEIDAAGVDAVAADKAIKVLADAISTLETLKTRLAQV